MFDLNNSLAYLLAKCHQKAIALSQERLNPYKITPPQAAALSVLFERNGISQLMLGEILEKDRTTVSGILQRLEAVGYVQRIVDNKDRRSHLVYATPEAYTLKEELEAVSKEVNHALMHNLSTKEQESVTAILKKIRA